MRITPALYRALGFRCVGRMYRHEGLNISYDKRSKTRLEDVAPYMLMRAQQKGHELAIRPFKEVAGLLRG